MVQAVPGIHGESNNSQLGRNIYVHQVVLVVLVAILAIAAVVALTTVEFEAVVVVVS